MDKKDKVIFGDDVYEIPVNHTEAEIREALAEKAPAIVHAKSTRTANGDGTHTWRFAEAVGTKG